MFYINFKLFPPKVRLENSLKYPSKSPSKSSLNTPGKSHVFDVILSVILNVILNQYMFSCNGMNTIHPGLFSIQSGLKSFQGG